MRILDPMYGSFTLGRIPALLAESPECRRLSEIRLLNTISPTLATLGEIKRYSHTLGVCFLESIWRTRSEVEYSRKAIEALQAAIILHDIGTPPFGHLFEYILKANSNWSHEGVIQKILQGTHLPENTAHQFFGNRTPDVFARLEQANVEMDVLFSILEKNHPLSQLIFGTIDFDNLDNVARMAWALGIPDGIEIAKGLASRMSVNEEGTLTLSISHRSLAKAWLQLRRRIYEILVFDWPTVAAQAVLTDAIVMAMRTGALDELSWSMTDDDLLRVLRGCSRAKDMVNLEYLGSLPKIALCVQVRQQIDYFGMCSGKSATEVLKNRLAERGLRKPLVFLFQDNGAFEKRLNFKDESSGEEWSIGERSCSTVIYIFERGPSLDRLSNKEMLLRDIESVFGWSVSSIVRVLPMSEAERVGGQKRLV